MFIMKLSDFNQEERNPICSLALRLCDIKKGLRFRKIGMGNKIQAIGTFKGEPFIGNNSWGEPSIMVKALVKETWKGRAREMDIYLCDAGVTRYGWDTRPWNKYNYSISGTPDGLTQYKKWVKSDD